MNYWLLKSEPHCFSIDDLEGQQYSLWDGVRNYQARNTLMQMQVGDVAFFYHSSTKIPGIVGLATIVETNIADPTQFDPTSQYYDPKATPEKPRWWTVKVQFLRKLDIVPLAELAQRFNTEDMPVTKKGNRLSVLPVSAQAAKELIGVEHGA